MRIDFGKSGSFFDLDANRYELRIYQDTTDNSDVGSYLITIKLNDIIDPPYYQLTTTYTFWLDIVYNAELEPAPAANSEFDAV